MYGGDASKERAFETDIEGFDNKQKERGGEGWKTGYSNWQEGD